MFDMARLSHARAGGGGLLRLVRRLVVLAFALIQAVIVGRILLDLGVIPHEGLALEYLVPLSDALAAPVKGLADGMGGLLGGGGLPGVGGLPGAGPVAGGGLNPTMVGALVGWTVVEGLVLTVVGKVASA